MFYSSDDLMKEHMYCEITEKNNLIQAPDPVSFFSPILNITGKKIGIIQINIIMLAHMYFHTDLYQC